MREILAEPLAHLEGLRRVWGTMGTTEAWVGSEPWEPSLIGLSGTDSGLVTGSFPAAANGLEGSCLAFG